MGVFRKDVLEIPNSKIECIENFDTLCFLLYNCLIN